MVNLATIDMIRTGQNIHRLRKQAGLSVCVAERLPIVTVKNPFVMPASASLPLVLQ